ncbi:MAG: tRNA-dihydrouridine synthase family protein [Pseudodesulfovibrio sp.]|uniref:Dihydrouridine synthase DuS n=2 Tax=Pseudodesulfovibrio aespoeensis TaxID=182210 RepID=E6VWF1_PSEA9|nr:MULTISPECIES: tRNA-dihydrouridine synthase family protein [Pseudodesulfovibrio]MBU4193268.1 tRNA-dihydrouridine synthase family protein [Pseudomonadota bacterium]ADU61357.1 dihydrouridine synthase DuS [Pseudodesulfovibrio aespoeensis Aspo-2]MBU4243826.1 tRNA-dihydrouridine synthase family protein [Pseudomonadota bacterium]MBU4378540.1 tRNA-dihydrouridine synthase family protein [Pseudomonadota bacterium]MBU4474750.1 tRNA-dihydrouridine synthase family protein [Pseudomonadota bacterium]
MHTGNEPVKSALAERLNRPLAIRSRPVANRLWLAPMAGLGHVAFREVLGHYGGCGLAFTEMCSARAVPTENRRVSAVFRWRDPELDRLVCQIAGADPAELAVAARRVEDEGFFGVDINMGCSVSGIVKKGAGAALLRDHDAALAALDAVRSAVAIPVFVKFRTGWSADIAPAISLARRLESAGADCLVFHPRVAPDKRTRPPMRDHIRVLAEAVSIPVFGNGDVVTPEDCLDMLQGTGCAGVSVGRMAIARPWIFAEWTGGDLPAEVLEGDGFKDYALRLADALDRHFDPIRALKRFKLFTIYFAANFTYGHSLQSPFLAAKTMDDVREAARRLLVPELRLTRRPNMNMYNI